MPPPRAGDTELPQVEPQTHVPLPISNIKPLESTAQATADKNNATHAAIITLCKAVLKIGEPSLNTPTSAPPAASITDAPGSLISAPLITEKEALALLRTLIGSRCLSEYLARVRCERSPPRVVHRAAYVLHSAILGHNGSVERVCFDNSPEFAFSGAVDGVVKLWSIRCGMLIASLYGHAAAISDICVSADGRLVASVDCQGRLLVWSVAMFQRLAAVEMEGEVIFCEFVLASTLKDAAQGEAGLPVSLVCVMAIGIVSVVHIAPDGSHSVEQNTHMASEGVKSVCITDGGRFILLSSWRPFLLLYDIQALSGVVVLEEGCAQTLCAARNALKIAAAFEGLICTYTFYPEGVGIAGNYKRRRGTGGQWVRTVFGASDASEVVRMCFLASHLLLAASADGTARLYDDRAERCTFTIERGMLCAHPTRDVFVVVGPQLVFYEVVWCANSDLRDSQSLALTGDTPGAEFINERTYADVAAGECNTRAGAAAEHPPAASLIVRRIQAEDSPVCVNDYTFSADGRFFLVGDDQGVVRTYAIGHPVTDAPAQQFFLSDLDTALRTAPVVTAAGATVDASRQCNPHWRHVKYTPCAAPPRLAAPAEALAAAHLSREHINLEVFTRAYLRGDPPSSGTSDPDDSTAEFSSPSDEHSSDSDSRSSATDNFSSCTSSDSSDIITDDSSESDFVRTRIPRSSASPQAPRTRTVPLRPVGRVIVVSSDTERPLDNVSTESRAQSTSEDSEESTNGGTSEEITQSTRRRGAAVRRAASPASRTGRQAPSLARTKQRPARNSRSGRTPANSSLSSLYEDESAITVRSDAQPPAGRQPRRASIQAQLAAHRQEQEEQNRRRTSLDGYSEEGQEQSGIDPQLERELAAFATEWLHAFPIYKNDTVHFNATAYKAFAALEGRLFPDGLASNRCPATGEYTVTRVEQCFIGAIPYLRLVLDRRHTLLYYEYPDGTGMVCLRAQCVRARQLVRVVQGGAVVEGRVERTTGLCAVVEGRRWLWAAVAVGTDIGLAELPLQYVISERVLFGRARLGTGLPPALAILNYDVVNMRLEHRLYRSGAQLVSDLQTIAEVARSLGAHHAAFAQQMLEEVRRLPTD